MCFVEQQDTETLEDITAKKNSTYLKRDFSFFLHKDLKTKLNVLMVSLEMLAHAKYLVATNTKVWSSEA